VPGNGCVADDPSCPHLSHYAGPNRVCAPNAGVTADDLYARVVALQAKKGDYNQTCSVLQAYFSQSRHFGDCEWFDALAVLARGDANQGADKLRYGLGWPGADHEPEMMLTLAELYDRRNNMKDEAARLRSELRTKHPESRAAKSIR
jgi:hypothetical protein